MPEHTGLLASAIAAAKAGNKAEARQLLAQVLRNDPQNEPAWLWLSGVVGTDDERIDCLERVLAINPGNPHARRGLAVLRRQVKRRTPPAYAISPPSSPAQPTRAVVSNPVRGQAVAGVMERRPLWAWTLLALSSFMLLTGLGLGVTWWFVH